MEGEFLIPEVMREDVDLNVIRFDGPFYVWSKSYNLTPSDRLLDLLDAGYEDALIELARRYDRGLVLGMTPLDTMRFLLSRHRKGNKHAQSQIGLRYVYGDQSVQDFRAAIHWLSRIPKDDAFFEQSKAWIKCATITKRDAPPKKEYDRPSSLDRRQNIYCNAFAGHERIFQASLNTINTLVKRDYVLGYKHLIGNFVERNDEKAMHHFAKAGIHGHNGARREFCRLWRQGRRKEAYADYSRDWCGEAAEPCEARQSP